MIEREANKNNDMVMFKLDWKKKEIKKSVIT